jgi:hypothetical protein
MFGLGIGRRLRLAKPKKKPKRDQNAEVISYTATDGERALMGKYGPFTMTGPRRQYGLLNAVNYIDRIGLEGDIVECGVWRGGNCMMIKEQRQDRGIRRQRAACSGLRLGPYGGVGAMLSVAKRILGRSKHRRKHEPRAIQDAVMPSQEDLVRAVRARAARVDALSRCLAAAETGTFTHPDGRSEKLGPVRIDVSQVALLSHLSMHCPTPLSVEVGFGMGTSATAILSSLALRGTPFEHLIFDPTGLTDGRGLIVADYLRKEFRRRFRWVRQPSEIGLAKLLAHRGKRCAGLIFIDGGHLFENVMADFVLADQLCCKGGYIVFDDALFPAIETVLNYITANRPDYAVSHLAAVNCSVAQKTGPDHRRWCSFNPFQIPQRNDWTPATPSLPQ